MHDALNRLCPDMAQAMQLTSDAVIFDQQPPLARKGCCLGFNFGYNALAYIPIARLERFKNETGNFDNLFNRELRKRFAVQSSVRKSLAACGVILEENQILRMEKALNTPVLTFSILTSGIDKVYSMPRRGLGGSLENSCMQGMPVALFALYEQVAECRLLVAHNANGDFVGRALLWESVDGNILCDRRYGASYYVEQALADYAISQGFFIKTNNDYDIPDGWRSKTDTLCGEQCVLFHHDITSFARVPYCDTFKWVDEVNGYLCSNGTGEYCLEATSGVLLYRNGAVVEERGDCAECEDEYHLEDMRLLGGEYYCDGCAFFCEECDRYHAGNHYITLPSGVAVCGDCQERYIICSECSDYAHEDSVRHFTNCEVNLCQGCIA